MNCKLDVNRHFWSLGAQLLNDGPSFSWNVLRTVIILWRQASFIHVHGFVVLNPLVLRVVEWATVSSQVQLITVTDLVSFGFLNLFISQFFFVLFVFFFQNVQGILIGLANLDGAVKTIRKTVDSADASKALQKGWNILWSWRARAHWVWHYLLYSNCQCIGKRFVVNKGKEKVGDMWIVPNH